MCRQLLRRPLPLSAQALPSSPCPRQKSSPGTPARTQEGSCAACDTLCPGLSPAQPLTPSDPGCHQHARSTPPRHATASGCEPCYSRVGCKASASHAWVAEGTCRLGPHGGLQAQAGPRALARQPHGACSTEFPPPRQADLQGLFNSSRYREVESPARTGGLAGQWGRSGSRLAEDTGPAPTAQPDPRPRLPFRAGKAGSGSSSFIPARSGPLESPLRSPPSISPLLA